MVKELLGGGADVNQATTDDGSTPLYIASQNGHLEVVKELLGGGADVNQARTDDTTTPLRMESEEGHVEVVKELLGGGAEKVPHYIGPATKAKLFESTRSRKIYIRVGEL